MTSPLQRFRAFPPGRRRFLAFEAGFIVVLVAVLLVAQGRGGVWDAIAVVVAAYAVGLVAHLVLVVFGWEPPRRDGRPRR